MVIKQVLGSPPSIIHKITVVYWMILNLPSKFHSSLHSIHLALLGKTSDIKQFGYEKFLSPLLKDIKSLEQAGVCSRSYSILCADHLGACRLSV